MIRIVLSIILLGALPLLGEQNPDALIRKGWEEYRFLSLDLAEKQFSKALKLELTPEQQAEALVGLAMTLQYAERGRTLDRAEEIYQQVLELQPSEEVQAMVLSNLADLHLARDEEGEALELLNGLIETSMDSVVGQDALRRRMLIQAPEYGTPGSVRVADEAAALLENLDASRERPGLLPLLHEHIGGLYFWAGEYEKAVLHYEQFSLIGSAENTNYGSQSSNLYRLAKIHEDKLNKPSRATQYYRRLVEEFPNSPMVYYALEKTIASGGMSRKEVRDLRLNGVTEEVLDELFSNVPSGGSGEEM